MARPRRRPRRTRPSPTRSSPSRSSCRWGRARRARTRAPSSAHRAFDFPPASLFHHPMTYETLKQRLAAMGVGVVAVDAQFTEFQRQTGTQDLDRFLAHLRDHGVVGAGTFAELAGGD